MSWTETTNETLTKKSILESKSVEGTKDIFLSER